MIDLKALVFLLILGLSSWICGQYVRKHPEPAMKFSDLQPLKNVTWRQRFAHLPYYLSLVALGLFCFAFLDPHRFVKTTENKDLSPPKEGLAIYMNVDQSGSMKEEVVAVSLNGKRVTESKLTLLKEVSEDFVKNRPNDLIGLVSFARTAYIEVPLTLDHQYLLQKLKDLQPLENEEESGTAIGYAVFKTVNLIVETRHYAQDLKGKGKPAYEIKNAIIVLITDGFQNINPEDADKRLRTIDVREAARYAKENNVRLYVVNVDPSMAKEEFTPHRKIMKGITELTGGQFFIVGSNQSLEDIYHDIDRLEKELLPNESLFLESMPLTSENETRLSYYPYFLALGILFLALSIVLCTTVLRRFP